MREKATQDAPIRLLLSGGGFRATMYHLGVIRYLLERGRLQNVREIFSVSGGSILAGYLALNWREFSQRDSFATASSYVIQYVQSDVRGQILRRHVACLLFVSSLLSFLITLFLFPSIALGYWWWFAGASITLLLVSILYRSKFSLIGMFEASLSRYLHPLSNSARSTGSAKLRDLEKGANGDGPKFRILATDLTSGSPWAFTRHGIRILEEECMQIDNELLPLSTAVAASAAFPPLFSPVKIPRSLSREQLRVDHYLTDGGVYDNLGIVAAATFSEGGCSLIDDSTVPTDKPVLLVSNAERLFERGHGSAFSLLIQRATRSTDILMARVSELHSSTTEATHLRLAFDDERIRSKIPIAMQRLIRNIRTDLDGFTAIEVQLLVFKGYITAWNELDSEPVPIEDFDYSESGVPLSVKDSERWLPFKAHELGEVDEFKEVLDDSEKTKFHWIDRSDIRGSLTLLFAALLFFILLNPIAWWAGRIAWGILPTHPSLLNGEWYEGAAPIPEKHKEIDVYLRQLIKPRPDETLSTAVFLSNPIREAYGWGPHGPFSFELSVADSYRMVRFNVLLIGPDNRLKYLSRQRDDDSIVYTIPSRSGDEILAIVMAIESHSEVVNPNGIRLPKVGEVTHINLNPEERK